MGEVETGEAAQRTAGVGFLPAPNPSRLTWRDWVVITAFAIATGGVAATLRGVWGFAVGFAVAGAVVAAAMMVGRWAWGLVPRCENETLSFVFYHILYIPVGIFSFLPVAAGSRAVLTGAAGPGQLVAFVVAAVVLGLVVAGRIFIKPPRD